MSDSQPVTIHLATGGLGTAPLELSESSRQVFAEALRKLQANFPSWDLDPLPAGNGSREGLRVLHKQLHRAYEATVVMLALLGPEEPPA